LDLPFQRMVKMNVLLFKYIQFYNAKIYPTYFLILVEIIDIFL